MLTECNRCSYEMFLVWCWPIQRAASQDADSPDSTWLALHVLLVAQNQADPKLQEQLQLLNSTVTGGSWAV